MPEEDDDEDVKLKRIKDLNPLLYKKIMEAEEALYAELNERMNAIIVVKDLVLMGKQGEARVKFDEIKKPRRKR